MSHPKQDIYKKLPLPTSQESLQEMEQDDANNMVVNDYKQIFKEVAYMYLQQLG